MIALLSILGTIGGWFGLSGKLAKAAGAAAVVVALVIVVWGGWAIIKGNVIEEHETRQAVETEKADRKADTNAAEQRREDEARVVNESRELEKAQANAETDLDRRLARHRCLRMQQDARAEGREPPACG